MARILVIDDSMTARQEVRIALAAQHEIVEAPGGPEALEILSKDNEFKLIICDVNMPQMDGLTVCKKVKEIESLVNIPILMLTTESSPEMREMGKKFGVLGWATKPFDPPKLLAAVNKITSK